MHLDVVKDDMLEFNASLRMSKRESVEHTVN